MWLVMTERTYTSSVAPHQYIDPSLGQVEVIVIDISPSGIYIKEIVIVCTKFRSYSRADK